MSNNRPLNVIAFIDIKHKSTSEHIFFFLQDDDIHK